MTKRFFALVLCIALCISFMPVCAFAERNWTVASDAIQNDDYDDYESLYDEDCIFVKKGRDFTIKVDLIDVKTKKKITDYTGFEFDWARGVDTGDDYKYVDCQTTSSPSLTLKNISSNQEWYLSITDGEGNTEMDYTFDLRPIDKMWFIDDSEGEYAVEREYFRGNDETLEVSIYNNFRDKHKVKMLSGYTFKWYKYTAGKWKVISGATKKKYKVMELKKSGKWKCVATDKYGDKDSYVFIVNPQNYGNYYVASKKTVRQFRVTVQKRRAKLIWKKVKGASGYEVFRATKKNGKYKKVATIKKGNTEKYVNNGLKSGKKYYYKMRTFREMRNDQKRKIKVNGKWTAVKAVKVR